MYVFLETDEERCYNTNSLVGREGFMKPTNVVKNGSVEGAIKVWKQKTRNDDSMKRLKEKQQGYLKPGIRRRNAKKEAIRNSRKNNRRRGNQNNRGSHNNRGNRNDRD